MRPLTHVDLLKWELRHSDYYVKSDSYSPDTERDDCPHLSRGQRDIHDLFDRLELAYQPTWERYHGDPI